MNNFVEFAFVFFIGSTSGWILELFFRRFFSQKKWVNPGFLTGPCLPIYGFGVLALYLICRIDLSWTNWEPGLQQLFRVVLIPLVMTLIEYVAGLIFIKGMNIKLWDYSSRIGNIQGIICPLFTLLWGIVGAIYTLFIDSQIVDAVIWLSKNLAFSFFIGICFGLILVDCFKSFDIANRIRKVAYSEKVVVAFESFKESVMEGKRELKSKVSFINPIGVGEPVGDLVRNYISKGKTKVKSMIVVDEKKSDNFALFGFISSLFGLNIVSLCMCTGGKKSVRYHTLWLVGTILSALEVLVILILMVLWMLKVI